MSIRKRLAVMAVLPLGVALLVSIYIASMDRRLDDNVKELQFVTALAQDVFDLNFLSDQYLIYQERQIKAQWLVKHDAIGNKLADKLQAGQGNDNLWLRLRRTHKDMGHIFTQLSNDLEVRGKFTTTGQLSDRNERLAGVLLIKAREMFSTVVRLAGSKQNELASMRERLNLSVIALFMSLALVISAISAISSRTIITSIARLRRGMDIVAAGSLDHRVERLADDELGHLATTFNGMTERLQSADANMRNSVAALRQEVAERKRAEEKARDLNNKLEESIAALEKEIANHRQTGEELRNKERLLILQSRQAAMGEMIGNIAHQWRQPLNLLALIVQSLPECGEGGELRAEHLKACTEKSMKVIFHMSQTIDDFRNFFMPDKEKVLFRVCDAVSRAVSIIEGSFAGSMIRIDTQSAGDPVINGYLNEFSQVLINILLNARDALVERNVDNPRVTITINTRDGKAVVVIADNAGGIPEEIMEKIFDPYFTTRGPDRGTGVGLFMSKTIIEKNMNGSLTARNVGEGAEFRIEV
ncbi:HAMP domain-containing protein [Geobacter hydrogenophilus]|uniref:histidine kinase n=1 Tax=Geobacter hydrogenophilus TaxID=40983 RepID=A0A9W6FXT8_9BACT|nr:ATP-binding protein [Geobacter hydrogenophilus]MBT0894822.1 HAMP domain-containing protein [Geobacter hydrogenophilus]GLI36773.1 hypothetical protein GHYDROH2_02740 [Geobacter hydrogenophilus]